MADIDETLRNAGWLEVGKDAGLWKAPDAQGASTRKVHHGQRRPRAGQAQGGGATAETEGASKKS